MSLETRDGWGWFQPASVEQPADAAAPDALRLELARAFARCFGSADGDTALRHLTDLTLRRALGPDAADPALRHLEGQRQLVSYIHALVARGRAGA